MANHKKNLFSTAEFSTENKISVLVDLPRIYSIHVRYVPEQNILKGLSHEMDWAGFCWIDLGLNASAGF
jgi:hypothetical protein